MTCSMPSAGRGPGFLLVGGKPEEAVWLAGKGFVACVIGEGDWQSAVAAMRENPCVEGGITISQGGRVWQEEQKPDLESIWAKHVEYEFVSQDVEATLATMVPDAYVNHIPVMTGGRGIEELREFYAEHFISKMPADTRMTPLSRTVGEKQIVDEMIFEFTHDIEMDWMLPGVAPTGRPVRVPLVAIVKLEGDKLKHEHIYWDQASVLVQIGLLDQARLPVCGAEAAAKAALEGWEQGD